MKSWSQTNSAPKIPSWPDTSSLPGRQTEPCSNSMFRTSILSWHSPEVQVHCHVSTEHWTNTSNTWFSSFPRDQELDWWLLQTSIVRLGRNVDKSWTECLLPWPGPKIHRPCQARQGGWTLTQGGGCDHHKNIKCLSRCVFSISYESLPYKLPVSLFPWGWAQSN